ncbi:MAG TPA: deoxyribonuclease IV [Pirellulales bacterium]|nr:deoxyribonuclease IV [Pirellulales bacterium]
MIRAFITPGSFAAAIVARVSRVGGNNSLAMGTIGRKFNLLCHHAGRGGSRFSRAGGGHACSKPINFGARIKIGGKTGKTPPTVARSDFQPSPRAARSVILSLILIIPVVVMPILGAHQSIAGGYYRAAEHAAETGCDCVQLFTKNNNQWRAKAITEDDAAKFQAALAQHNIRHPLAHDSYLINLAAPDEALWRKSVEAFAVELLRAEQLGIPYVVMHPGSFTTSSEEAGLARIVQALDEVHEKVGQLRVCTLLENTAGQGSALGWRFEHLATILDGVKKTKRLAVCIDTCHLLAAGYPISTPKDYEATMRQLDDIVGLKLVKAIHLNDSKKDLGSRVDRHEHIGRGKIGLEGFRLLLNDSRFADVPMYLETPKEDEQGKDSGGKMDQMNLAMLRSLVKGTAT